EDSLQHEPPMRSNGTITGCRSAARGRGRGTVTRRWGGAADRNTQRCRAAGSHRLTFVTSLSHTLPPLSSRGATVSSKPAITHRPPRATRSTMRLERDGLGTLTRFRRAAGKPVAVILIMLAPTLVHAQLTLLNVSYDPTREFYREFNEAFA